MREKIKRVWYTAIKWYNLCICGIDSKEYFCIIKAAIPVISTMYWLCDV